MKKNGSRVPSPPSCSLAITSWLLSLRSGLQASCSCLLALSSLVLLTSNAFGAWASLPPLPEPDGFFAGGIVGNKIVVAGGSNWREGTKHWLDSIWVFDFSTRQWKSEGHLPHPLAYVNSGTWNGALIITGGLNRKQPLDEVWRIGKSIRPEIIAKLRTETTLTASGIIGDNLFIFGGCNDPAEITNIRAGGVRLDLRQGTTSPLRTPEDTAFCLTANAVVKHRLFIFGGARPDPKTVYANLETAWAFDADRNDWRKLKNCPMPVRGAIAVNLDDRRILLGGGYGGQPEDFLKSAFIYDIKENSYATTVDFPVAAIVGALLRHNGVVYCLGGEDSARRTAACFSIKVSELIEAARPVR